MIPETEDFNLELIILDLNKVSLNDFISKNSL